MKKRITAILLIFLFLPRFLSADMHHDKLPADIKEKIKAESAEQNFKIDLAIQVFFDVSSSELDSEALTALDELAALVSVFPKNQIYIEGHADSSGKTKKNIVLSSERAHAVLDYLLKKGIDKDRMFIFGLGHQYPTATNDSREGKSRNRRVDILVLRAD